MHANYFTLRALAGEWDQRLTGARFQEAYSSSKGEITLVFLRGDDVIPLRVGTAAPFVYGFLASSSGRPRRNAPAFFSSAAGAEVQAVRVADYDRHVFVSLSGSRTIHLVMFGTRANVLLVGHDHVVIEAFRSSSIVVGKPAPAPRPAGVPSSPAELLLRMETSPPGDLESSLRKAIPVLDNDLAHELAHRTDTSTVSAEEAAFSAWLSLLSDLNHPVPRVIEDESEGERFSLLQIAGTRDVRIFESVNDGVAAFVRSMLARRAFQRRHEPLLRSIERMAQAAHARVESMAEELARPSRADEYERAGHLLMAHPDAAMSGLDRIELTDLFQGGTIPIQLDPQKSLVDNARRYYDRARAVRQRRQAAESRFDNEVAQADRWNKALAEIRRITTLSDIERFEDANEALLSTTRSKTGGQNVATPYREILVGGFQVFIGKSSRHNDALTFGIARKHDLWLHARGVPGSHVIVRVNRGQVVPAPILERIAALAAWHSKARGSAVVPVTVAERKHVRKARGGAPGSVIVERERVLTVEPVSPASL